MSLDNVETSVGAVLAVLAVLVERSDVASIEPIVDRLCLDGVRNRVLLGLELPFVGTFPGANPCCFGEVHNLPRNLDAALETLGKKLCLPPEFFWASLKLSSKASRLSLVTRLVNDTKSRTNSSAEAGLRP
jgi:hypothetical protein